MTYRYIVVNMGHPDDANRARIAAELATAHGAHLVGRYYIPAPRATGPGAAHAPTSAQVSSLAGQTGVPPGQPPADREADQRARAADRAQSAFEQAVAGRNIQTSFEAQQAGGSPLWERLLEDALCADLTIVGKPSGEAQEKQIPGRLVADSGGPVLVVPRSAETVPGARRVAIAWNGSREAARAVRDAMPLIEAAGDAAILMAKPKTGVEAAANRLQAWLERHGVATEVKRDHGGMRAADFLMSRVEEAGADVLVMGAYGRARLAELVTGGATTGRILDQTTVPLLMAQ